MKRVAFTGVLKLINMIFSPKKTSSKQRDEVVRFRVKGSNRDPCAYCVKPVFVPLFTWSSISSTIGRLCGRD